MAPRSKAANGAVSVRLRGWSPALVGMALLAAVALVSGLCLFSARAFAVINNLATVQQPGYLELTSNLPADVILDLNPGEPVYWLIGAELTDNLSSSLVLEIRKSGDLATHVSGLIVSIDRCSEPWENVDAVPSCGLERKPVLVATPLDDNSSASAVFDLAGIPKAQGKYLRVALSLNVSGTSADQGLMGLSGRVGIGLTAADDATPTAPGGDPMVPGGSGSAGTGGTLAMTGGDTLSLFLIAIGTLGLGVLFSVVRRSGHAPASERS